ncbi:MAG: TonB-dependent receptor [Cyclobacteriaceae bacterium]
MKLKLLRQLYLMSRLTLFGIIMQTTLCGILIAGNTNAQLRVKSLEEIIWNGKISEASLSEILLEIQAETGFIFAFNENLINKDQKVRLNFKNGTLGDLLRVISKESNVKFKRINDQIHVAKKAGSKKAVVDIYNNLADLDISGKVTDETGQGLPGASVVESGTANGTTTDIEGNYKLTVAEGASVTISFVGYKTQEVLVGSQSVMDVQMELDAAQLEEIVVVGYGTQKKATLTGSVAQVKGDDIIRAKATSSAALALQGELPGVLITRTTARPGNENLDIKIRGDISVNNVSPLILLDGLVIPESQLSTINQNDIENISVLKDASAAIYGTRASGGVILITTKKGQVGKPRFEYSSQFQMNTAGNIPLPTLKEWAGMWLESGNNDIVNYVDSDGVSQTSQPTHRFYTAAEFQQMIDGTWPLAPEPSLAFGTLTLRTADVNQMDQLYGDTWSQRHNLAVSGGTEKVNYRTSFGYNNERSPLKAAYDGAKRFNFRTNLSYEVNNIVSTNFILSFDRRSIESPNQGIGEGLQDPGFFPLVNPQGQYYDEFGGHNPLAKVQAGGRDNTIDQIIRLGAGVNIDLDQFVQGLSFGYDASFSFDDRRENQRKTSYNVYTWDGDALGRIRSTLANSYSRFYFTDGLTQMHTFRGNYDKTFDKHNFGLTVVAQGQLDEEERNYFGRTNFSTDALNHLNLGDVTTTAAGGSQSGFNTGAETLGIMSYVGRINYDYDGIYLFEALARRDGSSRLHPDFRWSNFYGASAGVNLARLPFLSTSDFFDNLKLRASWGQTGSTAGISAYDYFSGISTGTALFGVSPAYANTANINGISTTDRGWERVATTNFGLDFGIMNTRLSGTFEYFIRKNDDMLISVTYPEVLGDDAPLTNSGNFTTKGWELALNWRDQIGSVNYNVSYMIWDATSEVTSLEGAIAIQSGVNDPIEGKPLNAIYTYATDGILSSEEDVLDYYNQYGFESSSDHNVMKAGTDLPAYNTSSRLVPGNVRRVDVNGDGLINENDLAYFGDQNPHISMGLRLGASWKGFDVSMFFQGVADQTIVRTGTLSYPFANWWRNQNNSFYMNTWTPERTDADYPMMFQTGSRKSWNYNLNDINVVQASYLRAKLISFGYTLPNTFTSKIGLERVRISATGNDLFVISNVKDGMDPEVPSGVNQGQINPFASSFIFGLDISF